VKKVLVVLAATTVLLGTTASSCDSTRQIDPVRTGSFDIPGTSWKGFCNGRNAFIYVPSKRDSEPDELEAVIYDHAECIKDINPSTPPTSSKPDTDPDGIIDGEND
jgi:hypothetical protein